MLLVLFDLPFTSEYYRSLMEEQGVEGILWRPFRALKWCSVWLVLGHLGGNRRRLLQVFTKSCEVYFAEDAAKRLVVDDGGNLGPIFSS